MNRRRFLLALGIMVVAPALGAAEAVTEAMSYPEPGDLTPSLPISDTFTVEGGFPFREGDNILITDLSTGFTETHRITAIDSGGGLFTVYRS